MSYHSVIYATNISTNGDDRLPERLNAEGRRLKAESENRQFGGSL